MDAVTIVEDEVRELVRRRALDPARDLDGVRRLVDEVIAEYDDRALTGLLPALADPAAAARTVLDAVAGLGPLQRYLDDPEVEEVWVNEPGKVFIARAGRSELTTTILGEQEVRDLVERMLKSSGRRVDLSSPFVDATVSWGGYYSACSPDRAGRAHLRSAHHQADGVSMSMQPHQPYTGTPMGEPVESSTIPQQMQPAQSWGPHPPLIRPTSGAAVASLICSILWVFGLGSLLAILLAMVAWGDTGSGRKGGHGLAVTGLILGILGALPMLLFLLVAFLGILGVAGASTAP